MTERPEHRLTQDRLDDSVMKIVVISFAKARIIGRGLNISFRQRFELTFHIPSGLDLCHSCSLRSIALLSSKRWSTFICCVSWPLSVIVRLACVFSAVRGS